MIINALFIILIVSTALILGNEFSIGFLIHPSLARDDHRAFLPAIQVFARFFGKIMPIWMPGTLLLHLLLLWLTWQWPADHTVLLIYRRLPSGSLSSCSALLVPYRSMIG